MFGVSSVIATWKMANCYADLLFRRLVLSYSNYHCKEGRHNKLLLQLPSACLQAFCLCLIMGQTQQALFLGPCTSILCVAVEGCTVSFENLLAYAAC